MRVAGCWVVIWTILVTAPALTGQEAPHFAVGGFAAHATRQSEGSLTERLTGVTRGFEGRAVLWRFLIEVRYLEGSLDAATGDTERDIVEGEAFVGFRPVSWLTLKAGRRVRNYSTIDINERWDFWEVRLRAEVALFLPTTRSFALHSYLEGWRALSADVNVPASVDNGGGGEGGMMLRLTRIPIWSRIGYRIDRANLGDGTRRETVQQLIFALGIGG